eukprot:scaffold61033_cov81-Phaeocystis_antarctica.AAC.2
MSTSIGCAARRVHSSPSLCVSLAGAGCGSLPLPPVPALAAWQKCDFANTAPKKGVSHHGSGYFTRVSRFALRPALCSGPRKGEKSQVPKAGQLLFSRGKGSLPNSANFCSSARQEAGHAPGRDAAARAHAAQPAECDRCSSVPPLLRVHRAAL